MPVPGVLRLVRRNRLRSLTGADSLGSSAGASPRRLRATLTAEILLAAGAREVHLPFAFKQTVRSRKELTGLYERRIKPAEIMVISLHPMGTCRMGADPKRSVTDSYGECHDVKNLFVADASLFPTSITVNPQETIMALSTRIAEYINENAERYFG